MRRNEEAVDKFKVLSQNLVGETDETHEKP
jgi:hypothetical protein